MKKTVLWVIFVMAWVCGGCADSISKIDYLETDTYLSSTDNTGHASLGYLKVSKDGMDENRILVKLPTGDRDHKSNLDYALDDPMAILFFPWLIITDVLEAIFDCSASGLSAANLTEAKLVFSTDASNATDLATSDVRLHLTTKPWWQNANWDRAHYFSSRGKWDSPGGDLDPNFTPIVGNASGSNLEFDVTDYFRDLLVNEKTLHYGMILKTGAASQNPLIFISTQSSSSYALRPRLEHTYSCPSPSKGMVQTRQRVFYLGGAN